MARLAMARPVSHEAVCLFLFLLIFSLISIFLTHTHSKAATHSDTYLHSSELV